MHTNQLRPATRTAGRASGARREAPAIPITGNASAAAKLLFKLQPLIVALGALTLAYAASFGPEASGAEPKHPVEFSELRLRSSIAAANNELRQLKRDFMRDMTDVYLSVKMDPSVGSQLARQEGGRSSAAPTLVTLLNAEFADMLIKRHIVQRRLVSGLKVAFVKLLPLRTLRRLVDKFKAYAWLQNQAQLDVRPRFPGARENQLVQLYNLIELRARARAADDVAVSTGDGIRRVLQLVQFWLIESRHEDGALSAHELELVAAYASRVLRFYLAKVHNAKVDAMSLWERRLGSAAPLAELAGGERKLTKFIDGLLDAEGLDIELNVEASRLDWPPTISEEMIANLEKKWIPEFVLTSLGEDRDLLIENRRYIMNALVPDADKLDADLGQWADRAVVYLCGHKAVSWKY